MACHGGTSSRDPIFIGALNNRICCTSAPTVVSASPIDVLLGSSGSTVSVQITVTSTDSVLQLTFPNGGAQLPLGTPFAGETGVVLYEVIATTCDFEMATMEIRVVRTETAADGSETVAEATESITIVNTCPPSSPTPPEVLIAEIAGISIPNFPTAVISAPVGVPVSNSNRSIPTQVPVAEVEVFQVGFLVGELSQDRLDASFTGPNPSFPIGAGQHGFTIAAETPTTMLPGLYAFTWQCTQADVPLADPMRLYQRAVVFDRDNDPNNNFRAQSPFLGDYFDNSDSWYAAEYSPAIDWRLAVTDAQNGVTARPSAARCILYNQVQLFVIPLSEIVDNGSLTQVPGRYSTFAHEGDFGQSGGFWSADATHPVDEPRLELSLSTRF